jgi:hypothetical protein
MLNQLRKSTKEGGKTSLFLDFLYSGQPTPRDEKIMDRQDIFDRLSPATRLALLELGLMPGDSRVSSAQNEADFWAVAQQLIDQRKVNGGKSGITNLTPMKRLQ